MPTPQVLRSYSYCVFSESSIASSEEL